MIMALLPLAITYNSINKQLLGERSSTLNINTKPRDFKDKQI